MDYFFRNIAVFLTFLAMAAFCWIYGGTRGDELRAVMPWIWALLFEGLICFPQRRSYEDSVSARYRVWKGLRRDPVFYFTVAFLVMLAIPFVNYGLCTACDYPKIMAGADPKPPLPFLPFCVNVKEHFGVFVWFLPTLTAVLAARHALSRSGKRMLMEMLCWNAALMAVLGFVQMGTGAGMPFWMEGGDGTHFFSVFGYPNMAGAFFVLAFAMSVGVWQQRVKETWELPEWKKNESSIGQKGHRWLRAHYPLAAAALNFFAVLATLCRAGIAIVLTLAALAFVYHELGLLLSHRERAKKVISAAKGALGAVVFTIGVFVFAPDELTKEVDTIDAFGAVERVTGKGQYHTRVALDIFKDYPFFGVGGWGYRHFSRNYLTEDELRSQQTVGGVNVHNDYMQFLCEHGALGAICLLGVFLALVVPMLRDWYKLYRTARFVKTGNAPPSPRAIFCVPAPVFWTLMGCIGVMIHAFGDCPLRSAAVLGTFFTALAAAPGWIPHEVEEMK